MVGVGVAVRVWARVGDFIGNRVGVIFGCRVGAQG